MTAESTTLIDERNDASANAAPSAPPIDLSAERFSDILNWLKRANVTEGGADERRRPRFDIKARATIIPLCESRLPGDLTILVRDLSPAGIGFLYERPLSLDEEFALVLPRSGDTPAIVLCAVECWQPLAKNVYAIGARYVRVLRDGGDPPLPIEIDPVSKTFAPAFQHVHAKAS